MASYLLLQNGGKLLLQNGGGILLSTAAVVLVGDPGRMTLTQLAPTATITRAGLGTATLSRDSGTMTTTRTT